MNERVVYVTGGSRGIGLAIVKELVGYGYNVMAVARSTNAEFENFRDQAGGAVQFITADLETRQGRQVVAASMRDCNKLYGLVNNAGVAVSGLHVTLRQDSIERMWSVNVEAPMILCRAAAKTMSRSRNGRIVNISSICVQRAYRGLGVYTATKAALEGFSKVFAAEVGAWGINVNCVAPGFIATDMNSTLSDQVAAKIMRRSLLGREVTSADVSGAVLFLLSPAAENVTAQVIRIDAGAAA
jgi:3-oxoacyl-[acyl-carrier protein] reductase